MSEPIAELTAIEIEQAVMQAVAASQDVDLSDILPMSTMEELHIDKIDLLDIMFRTQKILGIRISSFPAESKTVRNLTESVQKSIADTKARAI
jgi:serine kinase of HPr protein (carbohydrate metabolism regulator)